MARNAASRKELSAAGLLGIVRRCFEAVADPVARRGGASLADCLMSGLAVYGLKYASLLKFDEAARGDAAVRSNLRRLYGVAQVPSDTRMRERLDEVDPRSLRSCYRRLFAALQRGKGLEGFACLDGHYLLSVDGTGHHSSKKVHCGNCCEKHHRDGTTTYYHMMLGAVLVHPEEREVFPLAAGADREDGRVEEERLRGASALKRGGEAAARGRSAGASAPETGGGGGRAGVERAAHRTAREAGHALHPGGQAGRPRTGGSSVPVRVGGQHARDSHGGVRRGGRHAAPVPLAERGAAERRELRPGGELPGIPGDHPGGQGPALLVGDGPAGRRGQPDGADARRAGALAACR